MYDYTKSVRVKKEELEAAEQICKELNTTVSSVFNLLLKQIIIQERIPFNLTIRKESVLGDSLPEKIMPTDISDKDASPLETPMVSMEGVFSESDVVTDTVTENNTNEDSTKPANVKEFALEGIFSD